LSNIESKIDAHNQQLQAIETNKALNLEIEDLNKDLKAIDKELNAKNEEIVEISTNKKLEESNKIKYEKAITK